MTYDKDKELLEQVTTGERWLVSWDLVNATRRMVWENFQLKQDLEHLRKVNNEHYDAMLENADRAEQLEAELAKAREAEALVSDLRYQNKKLIEKLNDVRGIVNE